MKLSPQFSEILIFNFTVMSGADLSVVFSQSGKEVKRLDSSVSLQDGLGDLVEKVKSIQRETNQFLTSLLSEHDVAEDDKDDDEEEDSDVETEPESKIPKIQS